MDGERSFFGGCCAGRWLAGVIEGEVVGGLRRCISVWGVARQVPHGRRSRCLRDCLRGLLIREGWGGRKSQWQGNGMEQGVSLESLTCEAIAVDRHGCFRPL